MSILTIPEDYDTALKACPYATTAIYGSGDVIVEQKEHDLICNWCSGFAAALAWKRGESQ